MRTSSDPPPDQPAGPPPAGHEFHPAAALFPLMDVEGPEFGELVADVREHGLVQPIVLRDGRMVDGRDRAWLAAWSSGLGLRGTTRRRSRTASPSTIGRRG